MAAPDKPASAKVDGSGTATTKNGLETRTPPFPKLPLPTANPGSN